MPNPVMSVQDSSDGRMSSVKGTNGAAHSIQKDAAGNTVLPAFSPGTSANYTAAVASSAAISLGSATTIRVQGITSGGAFCLKFGDSGMGAATTTDLYISTAGGPEKFYIPSGVTHFRHIRVGGSDCDFNLVLG